MGWRAMIEMRIANSNDTKEIVKLYKRTIGTGKFPKIYVSRYIAKQQIKVHKQVTVLGAYIWDINRLKNPYSYERRSRKDKIVWLEQIMVQPECQGLGIGKYMMEDFLNIEGTEFRLVCKPQLKEFYEIFGFEVEQEILKDGEVQLLMFKDRKE